MESNKLRPVFLSIGILIGFVLLIMFVLTQIAQRFSALYTCGCAYTLPVIIILLSGTGIVVGVLTYYFLSGSFEQKKKKFLNNRKQVLRFVDADEKAVMEVLLKNDGSISQSLLNKKLQMDRVKVFRVLEKLEQKNIIVKQKNGKTNKILLVDEIADLLL
jgi:uncharacterized membrane protein